MKNKLMNLVKYNRLFYKIYSEVMKMFLFVLKLLITPNPHLILFSSFGGKKFDDSPKEIYSLIKTDDRFRNYELVWAFHEPHKFEIAKENKIKTDTLKYFITALQARCWITNSAIERGVCFKGKNTFYFNTWHGTPIKIMGSDLDGKNKSFKMKNTNIDAMLAQGKYDIDIYSRVFRISRDQFCVFGLPRNDRLCNYTQNEKRLIKESLGIPSDKKVILSAL